MLVAPPVAVASAVVDAAAAGASLVQTALSHEVSLSPTCTKYFARQTLGLTGQRAGAFIAGFRASFINQVESPPDRHRQREATTNSCQLRTHWTALAYPLICRRPCGQKPPPPLEKRRRRAQLSIQTRNGHSRAHGLQSATTHSPLRKSAYDGHRTSISACHFATCAAPRPRHLPTIARANDGYT